MVQAQETAYDAIILDIMLPGKDRLSILQQLRAEHSKVPVIILTARSELEDRLEHSKEDIHIRVSNTAHEISPVDAEHLFERFFRVDAARTASGNVGLGLSLAREIMRAHHGTLELTKNGNPTIEFTASVLSR